jgi:hypothetical protein
MASAAPEPDASPADREAREPPVQREFHAEPRVPAPPHEPAPIAHFEPTPKADANKPYVVWSSAPTEKSPGPAPEPEE